MNTKVKIALWSVAALIGIGAVASAANPKDADEVIRTRDSIPTVDTLAPATTTERVEVEDTTTTEYVANEDAQEILFRAYIEENVPELTDTDAAVEFAHTVCEGFYLGITFDEMAATMIVTLMESDSMELAEASGMVLGAGVAAFCPEHINEIPGSDG